ncbi:MAG: ABC transporter substrate-binding protein [Pseudomonadota bacterium]|nr:ABC transporter substrate-binding protein [Pseudomonadota bacterium]
MGVNEKLDLICFPGAPNLPLFAALKFGFFADAGIDVRFKTTPSSIYQIKNLAQGVFQIAGTAFDNVVAYQEGQGAVQLHEPIDLFAFMGATRIELSLVVAPEIKTYGDLRGRSIALDALATGFAFVLYDMLEKAGVERGDCELATVGATPKRWESVKSGEHAGTLTIEPFTSIALENGFHVLQTSLETVPSYQGGVFTTSRAWAVENSEALVSFIRGYLAGLEWVLAPDNYAAAKGVLLENMPAIKPWVADAVMTKLLDPITGLTPGGELDSSGIETVLRLRSRYARPSKDLLDPAPYLDSTYFQRARGLN